MPSSSASRPLLLSLAVVAVAPACLRANPAFDFEDELADASDDMADEVGDGDGDEPTTGDGDGDPTTGDGDGDGDPTTGDGDGDGDPTTGDGDGDGDPTTGDGDGDGDPDPTTGDGDGDPNTTGDGDGDIDPNLCLGELALEDYFPFQTQSLAGLGTDGAPSFDLAPENCLLVMVCSAFQNSCNPETPYLVKAYSTGQVFIGEGLMGPAPLQLRFHPGGGECNGTTLNVIPPEYFGVSFWNGQGFQELKVKMPCMDEFDLPLYVATDGSTFWDIELSQPAALW